MAKKNDSLELAAAVECAAAAVAEVKDEELRRIAFDRILQHLLGMDGSNRPAAAPEPRSEHAPRLKARARSGSRSSVTAGPKNWVAELIADGLFDEPRSGPAIVEALNERGHNVTYQDLTRQLVSLTKERKLRRKKMPGGRDGKQPVWHYSNW